MRNGNGALTSCQRAIWKEVSDMVPSELRAARLAKRRRVFTHRRILSTSCRTDLGQRGWGGSPLFRTAGFCGNMNVTVAIASVRMV